MSARIQRILDDLAAAIREETASLPESVGDLGNEVRRARKAEGLSLDGVAKAAGLTKSWVWELEQGRSRNPTVQSVAALSVALGVPFLRLAQAALNTCNTVAEEPVSPDQSGSEGTDRATDGSRYPAGTQPNRS